LIGSPTHVVADSVLIGQILQNLITNAVTAARTLSSPRIRLHVYTYGKSSIVSVRDNGPGIAPDQHHRIFEPFYTTRRGHGGMGLGLALCREYALQMKAEISLWSMPGRGACFRVIFPSAPSSH
jgi:signal transduction histidine kinase